MSESLSEPTSDVSEQRSDSFVADSLAVGMVIMLAMTIVQRGVGFFRGIWFCRMLDDIVVGQWAMAYDFITMVTPVMLLGMPGSLPRYVEHYRKQGHLPSFTNRLLIATVVLGAVFFAMMLAMPDWFGWLMFDSPQSHSLVLSVGVGVIAIIVFNFVYQLVSALRQVRVASVMQFVQSVGFTVIGIGWLTIYGTIEGLIYSFVAATLLAILPGAFTLASGWKGLPKSQEPFEASPMWRRVLPFAIALWVMNLLTNVFALSDRYMILHLMPGSSMDGQAAIGQYHSGRIIPVLLMSLASMAAGVLMPYLSADWEAGRKDAVRERLRQIVFGVAVFFTTGAAVGLVLAPWFFETVLQDRYADGLSVMPMAFVFAIWVSIATVGQDYLWVAERGKLVTVAIGVGLVANILLNLVLLPVWGLHGAVTATLVANGIVLIGLWLAMARHGYVLDRTTYYATILPATLLAGPWTSVACVIVTCLVCPQVKLWIFEAWAMLANHLRRRTAVAS